MADNFTRDEFIWLDQVASDANLPPSAARLAIILLRYFNRAQRVAWPSVALLARNLSATERSIQRTLQAMAPKHLTIIVGGGRRATNRYQLNILAPDAPGKPRQTRQGLSLPKTPTRLSPFGPQKPRQNCQGIETETPTNLTRNPANSCPETPTEMSPEPTEENLLKEPTEDFPSKNEYFDEGKSSSKARRPSASKKAKPKASEAAFEEWFAAYPKSVERDKARTAYAEAIARGATSETLGAATARYAAECTDKDQKYTKKPANWLRDGAWKDRPPDPTQLQQPGTHHSPRVFVEYETAEWYRRVAAGHPAGLCSSRSQVVDGRRVEGWWFPPVADASQ
jgi:hypothetical protein